MSLNPIQTPTIAAFGGTAGVGLSFLTQLLTTSPQSTVQALARTPSKLSSLPSQHPSSLHIIQGDVRSLSDVKSCLVHNGRLVDFAVSTVGMTIKFSYSQPLFSETDLCSVAASILLKALEELESDPNIQPPAAGNRTKIVVLSTTGISDKGRDIPLLMVPMYHWMLEVPHADKKEMERVFERSGRREYVVIRPSFLVDGERLGLKKLRTSVEGSDEGDERKEKMEKKKKKKKKCGPADDVAVGYTISRDDVAGFILDACVLGEEERWKGLEGKKVTVTY